LNHMEIKNIYRYLYLAWTNAHTDTSLWTYTPREFSKLSETELTLQWEVFLQHIISDTKNSKALFFVNRLYNYLTPCG
jgi:hypothetical protein